jgi:hypothetical protein
VIRVLPRVHAEERGARGSGDANVGQGVPAPPRRQGTRTACREQRAAQDHAVVVDAARLARGVVCPRGARVRAAVRARRDRRCARGARCRRPAQRLGEGGAARRRPARGRRPLLRHGPGLRAVHGTRGGCPGVGEAPERPGRRWHRRCPVRRAPRRARVAAPVSPGRPSGLGARRHSGPGCSTPGAAAHGCTSSSSRATISRRSQWRCPARWP